MEVSDAYLGAERVLDAVECGADLAQALADGVSRRVVVDIEGDEGADQEAGHLQH